MQSRTHALTQVHASEKTRGRINFIEIQRLFPRRTFLVRVEDLHEWVGTYGHIIDPEDGAPCKIIHVVWSGITKHRQNLEGTTWASPKWRSDAEGRPTIMSFRTPSNETLLELRFAYKEPAAVAVW
jgi:hypothetical protein